MEDLSETPRIVCYHQTHYHNGKFVSLLPLLSEKTDVTHVIIAAIHINGRDNITLNDNEYTDPKNEPLWEEVRTLQRAGIKVLGMLGGAHQGSFTALDGEIESFEAHYKILHELVIWTGLDGLDLDVEEAMSLAGMIRLIDRLKWDLGRDFLITLAPVATAMRGQQNLSGFEYEALEKAFSTNIAWYNTQFYCGWGCMETTADYEKIIARGWPAKKIVIGLVTNPANCAGWVPDDALRETLTALKKSYPDLGGVMGWEYFNSMTEADGEGTPWCWAKFMSKLLWSSNGGEES
ncbi:hypothetical protein MMC12_003607 [Toensbergia leucococca]|nr:hypothetical protein [Toensbergia leucococca]